MSFFSRLKDFGRSVSRGIKRSWNRFTGLFASKGQRKAKAEILGRHHEASIVRSQSDPGVNQVKSKLVSAPQSKSAPQILSKKVIASVVYEPELDMFAEGDEDGFVTPRRSFCASVSSRCSDATDGSYMDIDFKTGEVVGAPRAPSTPQPRQVRSPQDFNASNAGSLFVISKDGVYLVTGRPFKKQVEFRFGLQELEDKLDAYHLSILKPIAKGFLEGHYDGSYVPHAVYIARDGAKDDVLDSCQFSYKKGVVIKPGRFVPTDWKKTEKIGFKFGPGCSRSRLCVSSRKRALAVSPEVGRSAKRLSCHA